MKNYYKGYIKKYLKFTNLFISSLFLQPGGFFNIVILTNEIWQNLTDNKFWFWCKQNWTLTKIWRIRYIQNHRIIINTVREFLFFNSEIDFYKVNKSFDLDVYNNKKYIDKHSWHSWQINGQSPTYWQTI